MLSMLSFYFFVVLLKTQATLHEEGWNEGGDDRQDEVADLVGGNVLKDSHNDTDLKLIIGVFISPPKLGGARGGLNASQCNYTR